MLAQLSTALLLLHALSSAVSALPSPLVAGNPKSAAVAPTPAAAQQQQAGKWVQLSPDFVVPGLVNSNKSTAALARRATGDDEEASAAEETPRLTVITRRPVWKTVENPATYQALRTYSIDDTGKWHQLTEPLTTTSSSAEADSTSTSESEVASDTTTSEATQPTALPGSLTSSSSNAASSPSSFSSSSPEPSSSSLSEEQDESSPATESTGTSTTSTTDGADEQLSSKTQATPTDIITTDSSSSSSSAVDEEPTSTSQEDAPTSTSSSSSDEEPITSSSSAPESEALSSSSPEPTESSSSEDSSSLSSAEPTSTESAAQTSSTEEPTSTESSTSFEDELSTSETSTSSEEPTSTEESPTSETSTTSEEPTTTSESSTSDTSISSTTTTSAPAETTTAGSGLVGSLFWNLKTVFGSLASFYNAMNINANSFMWGPIPAVIDGVPEQYWADGADKSNDRSAIQVSYPAGSVNPGSTPQGGTGFYSAPMDITGATNVSFAYSVFFPADFDFVKGGKLPGLYGGRTGCSGGVGSLDCFSTRLMWRTDGMGELYLYAPRDYQTEETCTLGPISYCNSVYGMSIGRGSWYWKRGDWTNVRQDIWLNTPGVADGGFNIWVDDVLVLHSSSVLYRLSPTASKWVSQSPQETYTKPLVDYDSLPDGVTIPNGGFDAVPDFANATAANTDGELKRREIVDVDAMLSRRRARRSVDLLGTNKRAEREKRASLVPIGFMGIMFHTFFGGSSASWETPTDQVTFFNQLGLRIRS